MDSGLRRDIEWDCSRVVIQFYNNLDAKQYDDLVDLFEADGVWKRQGKELEGQAAIMTAMQARGEFLVIRHVVTNIQIIVEDENNASSAEYVTIYRFDSEEKLDGPAPLDGPGVIFLYQDKLVRTDSGWKIKDKRGRPIMVKKKKS